MAALSPITLFFGKEVQYRIAKCSQELMCMSSGKLRIAISTRSKGGLEDVVSDVFSRANTFTVVEIEKGAIKSVKVLDNPAISYQQGAGPIVVKMLVDLKVDAVIANIFGSGAATILDQHHITQIIADRGTPVTEAVKHAQPKIQERRNC
jgi:predicted Fe-Mo cluster-binding NifX family protein